MALQDNVLYTTNTDPNAVLAPVGSSAPTTTLPNPTISSIVTNLETLLTFIDTDNDGSYNQVKLSVEAITNAGTDPDGDLLVQTTQDGFVLFDSSGNVIDQQASTRWDLSKIKITPNLDTSGNLDSAGEFKTVTVSSEGQSATFAAGLAKNGVAEALWAPTLADLNNGHLSFGNGNTDGKYDYVIVNLPSGEQILLKTDGTPYSVSDSNRISLDGFQFQSNADVNSRFTKLTITDALGNTGVFTANTPVSGFALAHITPSLTVTNDELNAKNLIIFVDGDADAGTPGGGFNLIKISDGGTGYVTFGADGIANKQLSATATWDPSQLHVTANNPHLGEFASITVTDAAHHTNVFKPSGLVGGQATGHFSTLPGYLQASNIHFIDADNNGTFEQVRIDDGAGASEVYTYGTHTVQTGETSVQVNGPYESAVVGGGIEAVRNKAEFNKGFHFNWVKIDDGTGDRMTFIAQEDGSAKFLDPNNVTLAKLGGYISCDDVHQIFISDGTINTAMFEDTPSLANQYQYAFSPDAKWDPEDIAVSVFKTNPLTQDNNAATATVTCLAISGSAFAIGGLSVALGLGSVVGAAPGIIVGSAGAIVGATFRVAAEIADYFYKSSITPETCELLVRTPDGHQGIFDMNGHFLREIQGGEIHV